MHVNLTSFLFGERGLELPDAPGGSSERRNLNVQLSNLILSPQKLSNISSTVATALYTLANDGTAPDFDIKADEALVSRSSRIL